MNASQLLATALSHHQAGALHQAEELYEAILAEEPDHVDALHLLGVMAHQQGRQQEAIALIGRAIDRSPSVPAFHNNLANALKAAGESAKAEASYRRSLLLDRNNAGTHYNLGTLLQAQARWDEARLSYQAALRCAPKMAAAHLSLIEVANALGDADMALHHGRKAVRCAPEHPAAHNALGNTLLARGDLDSANASYERALALDPRYADAHYNVGNLRRQRKDAAGAIESYRQALEAAPGQPDFYNNLGLALADLRRHSEAIAQFDRAIALRPDYLRAFQNRGVSQEAMGDLVAAAASYRDGLALQPDHRDLRTNLGSVLMMQGLPEGIAYLEQIVEEQPDSAEAHFWLSAALLTHGDYWRGWPEYEWRWRREAFTSPRRNFPQPQWLGEPLHGEIILLHAEQGLGDTLQFARYAPLVAERGGRVVLEVQPALYRLLKDVPGVAVCLRQGDPLPEFSLHCPLMSLPLAFATTRASIPSAGDFLPSRLMSRQAGVTADRRLRVGLVWAGHPQHGRDHLRSLAMEHFAPLAGMAYIDFVSLQRGVAAAVGFPFAETPLATDDPDFLDTANVVATLDLVIAVDTSVAHLAGAMGKPVWILLANCPDWRWGLACETTPWYPTARLFRQTFPSGPEELMWRVAAQLAETTRP